MIRYGVTIFLSAFLLFQVQPMIARFILPWFGGTAAVWTTCMMFFQVVLLLGYLYAHLLRRLCSPRFAWLTHLIVLASATALAAVVPAENLRPTGDENLTLAIIGVLALSIGMPFFVLSSTSPLIQAWQSSSHVGQSPYRLYALSNLGSMLALVTYPFLIERFFPMATQARYWMIGFCLFAILCSWCGWQTVRLKTWASDASTNPMFAGRGRSTAKPRLGGTVMWFVLAMTASVILLATTNLMCQEVASIPFLWILPLSLYLLSFIICFDRPALYQRRIFIPLLVMGTVVSIALVHLSVFAGLALQVAGLATVCFAASMTCHGELERLKPAAEYLTGYYLWIAFGGAVGGVFVCVVAPMIFTSFLEFQIGLMICLLVALKTVLWPKPVKLVTSGTQPPGPSRVLSNLMAIGIFVALSLVVCSMIYFLDPSYEKGLVFRGRNEYGLVSVVEDGPYRRFINGRIEHGGQRIEPGREMEHISYYMPQSGAGLAFDSYRSQADSKLNVAVIGLGAGAMATWMEPGDEIVFYEINPMVELIAKEHFEFLKYAKGKTTVKLGDGRLQLQNEAAIENSPKYDLLFMDAFSSDSIPVHLLTAQCFELYLQRLKPNGVLIAHITNRFIDLRPVLLQHAIDHGLTPILIDYHSADKSFETRWVLLTRNEQVIESEMVKMLQSPWPFTIRPVRWTDDYASVAALLNWSAGIDWERMGEQLRNAKKKSQESDNPKSAQ